VGKREGMDANKIQVPSSNIQRNSQIQSKNVAC
jgi:hypothetical protein